MTGNWSAHAEGAGGGVVDAQRSICLLPSQRTVYMNIVGFRPVRIGPRRGDRQGGEGSTLNAHLMGLIDACPSHVTTAHPRHYVYNRQRSA